MASWYLAPALGGLRGEFNALAPDRDKRSDGTVGDLAHQATGSKHNPNSAGVVRAFDCDKTGPWPDGMTFTAAVHLLADRHRRGLDDRLQNIIWDRRIWSRSWGWTARPYTGANAHTEHGHFEVRDSATYWNKRGPWGLLAEWGDMPTAEEIAKAVWAHQLVDGYDPTVKKSAGTYQRYSPSKADVRTVAALAAKDDADEAVIIAGVLAGLDAAAIAAAVVSLLPEDRDDITVEELTAAVIGALEDLAKRPPA